MIQLLQTSLLALVQGVTEFLPISSSAHLILPALLSPSMVAQRSVLFDAALHGGTLLAVILFFRQELRRLLISCLPRHLGHRQASAQDRHFLMMLCVASLPVLLAGYFVKDIISQLHRLPIIALATFIFGLFLWHAVQVARKRTQQAPQALLPDGAQEDEMQHLPKTINLGAALGIGIGQIAALVPGVSRSGVTITFGLWFGLSPQAASRFSFLLAIPVTFAASVYGFYQLIVNHLFLFTSTGEWFYALYGAAIAFVFAYLTIGFFLHLLERVGMMPFVIYRLLLGSILLFYWWFFQTGTA